MGTFRAFFAAVLVSLPAQGAVISLRAVKVNDQPIAPAAQVSVHPRDTIVTEFYVQGWNADLVGSRLRTLQVSIDRMGYVSGPRGMILPRGWDAPLDIQACQDDLDCPAAQPRCERQDDFCESFCLSTAECPTEYPICTVGLRCIGVNHNPADGNAFIDTTRPDFVHFDQTPISLVRMVDLGFAYGSVPLVGDGPLDTGVRRYLGTLTLVASDDACGAFTIGFVRDVYQTFVNLIIPTLTPPLTYLPATVPLVVNVACGDLGACCDCLSATCVNGVRPTECVGATKTFRPGEACPPSGACPGCSIPTVSEWGLATLTLCLLVGAKLLFGRGSQPLSGRRAV